MNKDWILDLFSLKVQGVELVPLHKQNGPPVLALHGWLDNCASFEPMWNFAKSEGYHHIVSIDLPGHGWSDHLPQASNYNMYEYALYCLEMLDVLDWKECVILGHSLGAAIGLLMASAFPERVKGLFLIENFGAHVKDFKQAPEALRKYGQQLKSKQQRQSQAPSYENLDLAAQRRSERSDLSFELAKFIAHRGCKKDELGKFRWSTDPKLMLPPITPFFEPEVCAFLDQVNCPVELVLSDRGIVLDYKGIEERFKHVKKLKTIIVQGGHHVHMEKPQLMWEYFGKFYNQFRAAM